MILQDPYILPYRDEYIGDSELQRPVQIIQNKPVITSNPIIVPFGDPRDNQDSQNTPIPLPVPETISVEGLANTFITKIINPIVERVTSVIKNSNSLESLASVENQKSINSLLQQLATLKIYFEHRGKISGQFLESQLNQAKANAIDMVIKNVSRTYEMLVKTMGGNPVVISNTFVPSQATNVAGINLNWMGANIKGSYSSFSVQTVQSKPMEITNTPTTDSSAEVKDKGPNYMLWLGGSALLYLGYRIFT